jgi:membrane-bound ClpP family serine protease
VLLPIKFGEEIHPFTAKWDMMGELGEVVRDLDKNSKGVIRVRPELWSPTSEARICAGAKGRVARVEALLARVAKTDEGVRVPHDGKPQRGE